MLKAWIHAFRLKTLPLALGAIIIGSALQMQWFRFEIFAAAALTAILLQILSNIANDYGDFVKGTDKHRSDRQMAGGTITPKAMKIAIGIFTLLALISGCVLLWFAFGDNLYYWFVFLGLGLLCILAALMYTLGKKAYGYYGLGDLFVLLFFGLVGVMGTAFLYRAETDSLHILPAIAYGLMCVAVLNVNNIRDMEKDILNNKITLASKLGKEGAGSYQAIILLAAVVLLLSHHFMKPYNSLAPIALAIITYLHLTAMSKAETADDYNRQLKLLSLGSFGVSLLFVLEIHY